MVPVILAAGAASRHPNKLLLPIAGRRFLLQSAYEYARAYCGKKPIIIASGIISTIVRRWKADVIIQEKPTGVLDAIKLAGVKSALVLFGDNIYDYMSPPEFGVACKASDDQNLDAWKGRWLSRETVGTLPRIAGYLNCAFTFSASNLLDELNAIHAQPVIHTCPWFDLGTPQAYKEYVECVF